MYHITTNVDQKLLRTTKFPAEFSQKVDTTKINVPVIKNWAAAEVSRILSYDDDVVIGLLFDLLEGSKYPDIKSLQIQLTGFLAKDAAPFCAELWNLCLSAQKSDTGIPQQLVEAKKLELIQEKVEQEKAAEAARQRREHERARDEELNAVRNREREGRGRGFGGRGGRGERDHGGRFDDRYSRRVASRSPPPRRRHESDEYRRPRFTGPPRETDSYVPGGDGRGPNRRRRSRSRSPRPRHHASPDRSLSPVMRQDSNKRVTASKHQSRSPHRPGSRRDSEADQGRTKRRRYSPEPRRRSPSPTRRSSGTHRRLTPESEGRRTRSRTPPYLVTKSSERNDDKPRRRRRRSSSSSEGARANYVKGRPVRDAREHNGRHDRAHDRKRSTSGARRREHADRRISYSPAPADSRREANQSRVPSSSVKEEEAIASEEVGTKS